MISIIWLSVVALGVIVALMAGAGALVFVLAKLNRWLAILMVAALGALAVTFAVWEVRGILPRKLMLMEYGETTTESVNPAMKDRKIILRQVPASTLVLHPDDVDYLTRVEYYVGGNWSPWSAYARYERYRGPTGGRYGMVVKWNSDGSAIVTDGFNLYFKCDKNGCWLRDPGTLRF